MRILIIIPAFNEQDSILSTAQAVLAYAKTVPHTLDVLVINDGSTDDTGRICQLHGIPCANLPYNLGIGGAMQCGYRYALEKHYQIGVQFDGDGQHDIHCLNALLDPLLQGTADFTIGSRFLTGESDFKSTGLRRLGIRWLSGILWMLTGQKITDPTSGFRAATGEVMLVFCKSYPKDYPEPESVMVLLRDKKQVAEVPVNMFPRTHGKSSIHTLQSAYYMLKVSLAVLIAR